MARASIRLQQAASVGRVNRHPQHTYNIRQRPFEITPFLLAPVLPGETLRNILFQSRVISDPIADRKLGWWYETFWFYVKHRDLDERDTLTAMMLDPATSVAALRHATGDNWLYVADDDINWVTPCLKRIVEEYFRDQGEAWNTYVITAGRPASRIHQNSWLDSVVDRTTILAPDDVEILDISAQTTIGSPADDKLHASDLSAAMRQWEFLRDMNMTNQTYEDYLATYGVKVAQVEPHKPELIRETHQWQYPVSAINPATGAAVSAVQWTISERLDKDRFFTEPGFIFAVSVVRPKIYMQNQSGAAAGLLDNAFAWLPAVMNDDPATSLKEIVLNNGPLQATTNNYVVDVRDIFLYGDQFINYDQTLNPHSIALPNAALSNKKYPAIADVDNLFVDTTTGVGKFETDGIASITIAGKQVDAT